MRTSALLALLLAPAWAVPPDEKAPDFTLSDVAGVSHRLSDLKDRKAVVLVFMGIECPRSVAAEPRLGDMMKKYRDKGVEFLAIDSNWNESAKAIADHAAQRNFPLPYLKDEGGKVATLYGIDAQPTAVLLDGSFTLRYRGMIDDHKVEELAKKKYLRDAIDSVLAGKAPEVSTTDSIGCTIKKGEPKSTSAEVTYSRDIAPILNRACVNCHRSGQAGPFSLETYDQAQAWSSEIKSWSGSRSMPPWKPVSNHGMYYNERTLNDSEIALLAKWHDNGAPMGDAKDLPPAPRFAEGWMLGTPDAVVKAEGGFELAAKGRDEYRCYAIRNPFTEDKWISGIEYRAGNSRAIHHIIGYLDISGQAAKKDEAEPGPGYKSNGSGPMIFPSGSLSGWAPGNMPRMLPEGTARLLRKGEWIVLETHYHRTGRVEKDSGSEVALYFAKTTVRKQYHVHMIAQPFLKIPPGEKDYKTGLTYVVPKDVHALDVMPHMHLIGREISVVATYPDGKKLDLVAIKDWDFNWQETYQFKEPLDLPRGTRIRLDAKYDNSPDNPSNPSNPPRDVRWGEQTTDEMCIAFIGFTNDKEDLTKKKEEEK